MPSFPTFPSPSPVSFRLWRALLILSRSKAIIVSSSRCTSKASSTNSAYHPSVHTQRSSRAETSSPLKYLVTAVSTPNRAACQQNLAMNVLATMFAASSRSSSTNAKRRSSRPFHNCGGKYNHGEAPCPGANLRAIGRSFPSSPPPRAPASSSMLVPSSCLVVQVRY